MAFSYATNPERDELALTLVDSGITIANWKSYSYNEHFLTPCDGWQFTIADENLAPELLDALHEGARVRLTINDLVQSTGFIDTTDIHNSPSGGTEIHVEGRDILAPVVTSHLDPTIQFNEGMSLLQVMEAVFTPFGITVFATDNEVNANVITGAIYGTKHSKNGRDLKRVVCHQLKPYPKEGAFSFAARVAERHGLWIWPLAVGSGIVVGRPDGCGDNGAYTLPEPRGALIRKTDDGTRNNILSGGRQKHGGEQPAVVFASGTGGGGEFAHAQLRGALVNPMVSADLTALKAKWPGVEFKTLALPGKPLFTQTRPVAFYEHDDESKDQEQVEAFLRRDLSRHMQRALTYRAVIEGHSIGGAPVAVNTIQDVDDDRANVHEPLFVLSRHFEKRAGTSGTTSQIELIRPGAIFV